jgi:hypothetical protein
MLVTMWSKLISRNSKSLLGVGAAAAAFRASEVLRCESGKGWFSTSAAKPAEPHPLPVVLPPLRLQNDFDVVIVGGGIVGLAVAREILMRHPNLVSPSSSATVCVEPWDVGDACASNSLLDLSLENNKLIRLVLSWVVDGH